ncbi:NUDIX hydrolase [Parenemella sanctibonifatiensis]|uniref:DNA mismatch repair protein MutT n=1 Tax=Parenemella sanctibonifatiensis TaxID=2016505 RepID=A0A255E589_9ACTN|nr:NUDIX hydrolase [Parenemella sanctibonifatiensis]OYN84675.1 DNA mismatch repair protein MutT [Parenemella sanctibonifatiensis]
MIRAAGAVVIRDGHVLVVHRPRYDDWSMPKGKVERNEVTPVTAQREVLEETAVAARLDWPLRTTRHRVGDRKKQVWWWRASVRAEAEIRPPDSEVDKVEWWPIDRASKQLSYPDEQELLGRALAAPTDGGLVLVLRHAKAVKRSVWEDAEPERPLNKQGEREAGDRRDLMAAYGIDQIWTSPWRRCWQTVAPYAVTTGLPVRSVPGLSEDHVGDVAGIEKIMAEAMALARGGARVVVCGHRPLLDDMLRAIGAVPRPLRPGESVAVHVAGANHYQQHDLS